MWGECFLGLHVILTKRTSHLSHIYALICSFKKPHWGFVFCRTLHTDPGNTKLSGHDPGSSLSCKNHLWVYLCAEGGIGNNGVEAGGLMSDTEHWQLTFNGILLSNLPPLSLTQGGHRGECWVCYSLLLFVLNTCLGLFK